MAQNTNPLPNDPNVNPDANACFTGGSMEGKCGDSRWGDADYMWTAGWYKVRYDYGLISRSMFPDLFKWLLPISDPEASCTIQLTDYTATVMGISDVNVQIPLRVIYGQFDPNASSGVTPYGFDWLYIAGGGTARKSIELYGPSTDPSSGTLWYIDFNTTFGVWTNNIKSTDCPTPILPSGW